MSALLETIVARAQRSLRWPPKTVWAQGVRAKDEEGGEKRVKLRLQCPSRAATSVSSGRVAEGRTSKDGETELGKVEGF